MTHREADEMSQEPDDKKPAETFDAHGQTWTRHTPGDPVPCDGEARVDELANLPADWNKDSSLETWFPFDAQELATLRAENARMLVAIKEGHVSLSRCLQFLPSVGQILDDASLNDGSSSPDGIAANRARAALAKLQPFIQ